MLYANKMLFIILYILINMFYLSIFTPFKDLLEFLFLKKMVDFFAVALATIALVEAALAEEALAEKFFEVTS